MQLKLVPPNLHQSNSAEQEVRKLNNHFIAAICTARHNFQLYLWDRILTQVTMAIEM